MDKIRHVSSESAAGLDPGKVVLGHCSEFEPQDAVVVGNVSSRASTVRLGILLGIFVVAILCLALFAARPTAITGKFPGRFSEYEKKEIASLIRRDAYLQSVGSLGHGELRQAWRWIVDARKQEVYAVGNQPAGEIWVHVGVKDKSLPEGYYLSARYIMKKEKGHWKIMTLF